MSLVMFNHNTFSTGHIRSHSQDEIMNFADLNTSSNYSSYRSRKRMSDEPARHSKRSRTAPPSPLSPPHEAVSSSLRLKTPKKYSKSLRSRSLSPNKRLSKPLSPNSSSVPSPKIVKTQAKHKVDEQILSSKIKLPSISSALNSAPLTTSEPVKLKPIAPTISLNYFDTYKPNDENWRYEVLDSINRGSKHYNLNQYNYLNHNNSSAFYKPSFDSRISSKILRPTLIPNIKQYERKINFPYESNYTYLNKTYLNDVEKYPEYLELAESLIQLSKPKQMTPPSPLAQSERPKTPPQKQFVPSSIPPPITSQASTFAPHSHQKTHMASHPAARTDIKSAPLDYSRYHYGLYDVPGNYATHNLPSAPPHYDGYAHKLNAPSQMLPLVPDNHKQHYRQSVSKPVTATPVTQNHRFIPITPPSSTKSKSKDMKSPPKNHSHHSGNPRVCISCGSDQSPCWRPSWSIKEGQLCNSCGLRYKKTSARCLNKNCKKIPAKGDWSLMQSKGKSKFDDGMEGYSCLECGWMVEVKK